MADSVESIEILIIKRHPSSNFVTSSKFSLLTPHFLRPTSYFLSPTLNFRLLSVYFQATSDFILSTCLIQRPTSYLDFYLLLPTS